MKKTLSENIIKIIYILTGAALFLFSLYTLAVSVNNNIQFIDFPYQHELREGAVLCITNLYINDENPFDISHQPQETYDYGFLYPMVVSPLAKVYGNSLSIHRRVTYVFILLSCILVFLALISKKVNPVLSFAAAVIMHQTMVSNAFIAIARPEGMGIFFLLLTVLIPWRYNFTFASCILSILCGSLALLTKLYYFAAVPIMIIYLFLFVSKRKSVLYAFASLLSLLIIYLLITYVLKYETFFNTVVFQQWNDAGYNYKHMQEQLIYFLKINIVLLIIIAISLTAVAKKYFFRKSGTAVSGFFNFLKSKFIFIKSLNIFRDEPLIKTGIDLLFYSAAVFGIIIFIFKLGGNKGNGGGAYLFHLVSPFLILSAFLIIKVSGNKLVNFAAAFLLIYTLTSQFKTPEYDFEKSAQCYEKIEDIMRKSKSTFNSPEVVSIMIEQNKPVYNSGHTQFFVRGINPLSLKLGFSDGVEKRNRDYLLENNRKIINRDFDLILLSKGSQKWPALVVNYECIDTLCAPMIFQDWEIERWYPVKTYK